MAQNSKDVQRRYRVRNLEKVRARGRDFMRTWRATHPEEARQIHRKYYLSHQEAARAHQRKRKGVKNPTRELRNGPVPDLQDNFLSSQ